MDDDKLLIYFSDEEHLIRRLGSAVVSCWTTIPSGLQQALVERAQRIADDEGSEHLGNELQSFIRAHVDRVEGQSHRL